MPSAASRPRGRRPLRRAGRQVGPSGPEVGVRNVGGCRNGVQEAHKRTADAERAHRLGRRSRCAYGFSVAPRLQKRHNRRLATSAVERQLDRGDPGWARIRGWDAMVGFQVGRFSRLPGRQDLLGGGIKTGSHARGCVDPAQRPCVVPQVRVLGDGGRVKDKPLNHDAVRSSGGKDRRIPSGRRRRPTRRQLTGQGQHEGQDGPQRYHRAPPHWLPCTVGVRTAHVNTRAPASVRLRRAVRRRWSPGSPPRVRRDTAPASVSTRRVETAAVSGRAERPPFPRPLRALLGSPRGCPAHGPPDRGAPPGPTPMAHRVDPRESSFSGVSAMMGL